MFEGAKPLPIPIAAKPLEASGEAASSLYRFKKGASIDFEIVFTLSYTIGNQSKTVLKSESLSFLLFICIK